MNRLPLRLRLTVLVTVLFGVALTTAAVAGLLRVEHSLETDTRNSAAALLDEYLGDVLGGSIGPADPDPADATRFIYLDQDGNELSGTEYQQILLESLLDSSDFPPFPTTAPPGLDPTVGDPILVEASTVAVAFQPLEPDGEPMVLDRGADVIAIGLPVLVGDTPLTIAVSSPLQPVNDSVDTLRQLLLIAVPLLTLAIAVAAWIAVGRALRPVDAITAQVDRITTNNLHQRVPEPAADDELGHLANTMNQMLSRLEHAQHAQRQFISDASHELRSPITATQATLEVARNPAVETDWSATADVLLEENARLSSLVDDLLFLARLDETATTGTEHVDLDELCLTEADRPHPRPVQVHVEHPARVQGNPGQLARAIRNLVDNAADHATNRVDVTLAVTDNTAIITIADDGPGIPTADRDRIFDRFSRLDSSRNRTQHGGAGLGLAITKKIVEAHRGTITADDPDEGARFVISLPREALPMIRTGHEGHA